MERVLAMCSARAVPAVSRDRENPSSMLGSEPSTGPGGGRTLRTPAVSRAVVTLAGRQVPQPVSSWLEIE